MSDLLWNSTHPSAPLRWRLWCLAFGFMVVNFFLLVRGQLNLLCALLIFSQLAILSVLNKHLAILVAFAYLLLLGDIRRVFGSIMGWPTLDLLLLVGPILTIFLVLPLLLRLRLSDPLSKCILALMVLMTLEIFNPKQGGIAVGVSGAMFYLVPLMWFWIGRQYATDELVSKLLYRVIFPLGMLATILGIYQTYFGFLPWEQAWIDYNIIHLHSIHMGNGFYRPFGYSVNGLEYGDLLIVTCSLTLGAFFSKKRLYGLLLPLPFIAIVLSAMRSPIVKLLVAAAVGWALSRQRGRGWLFRFILGVCILGTLLMIALNRFGGGDQNAQSASDAALQHQTEGLSHPLDPKHSTAGLHAQMFGSGILRGILYPIGYGLGSTTLGSGKFGGNEDAAGSSEVDISDIFTTLGVLGGVLYFYICIIILQIAFNYARNKPKSISLPVIVILFGMAGNWMALGQYAITPFIWLLVGAMVRAKNEDDLSKRQTAHLQTAHPLTV